MKWRIWIILFALVLVGLAGWFYPQRRPTGLPRLPSGNTTPMVVAGWLEGYVIAADGTLWRYGDQNGGVLDVPESGFLLRRFDNGTNWIFVDSKHSHALAIKSDGTLWGWGDNFQSALGMPDTNHGYNQLRTGRDHIDHPVQIGRDTDWKVARTGQNMSYALKKNGTVWCWGDNRNGELADPAFTNDCRIVPAQFGTNSDWVDISVGWVFAGLRSDGTIWNTTRNFNEGKPHLMQTDPGTNWAAISISEWHLLALKTDGSL